MSKHTPGPWKKSGKNGEFAIDGPKPRLGGRMVICEQVGGYRLGDDYKDFSQIEANANLILAAPEMLEALQAAKDLWGDYLPPGNSNAMKAMKLVNSAINKAKGL